MLKQNLPVTVSLSAMSLAITIAAAAPLSIYLAKNNGKKRAVFLSALSQIGVAVPPFWLGVLLILGFAVFLRILPSGDFIPFSVSPAGALRSLILPAAAISAGTTAVVVRYLKNALLDQFGLDYVRTAKSKGMTQNKILYKHVLKNALLPTVTIMGMIVSDILGGSIIVENVFNLPGIGKLLISGVGHRDFVLVQGLTFYMALTVIVINLFVDLLCMAIDPRVSFRKSGT
jgi:peptide/nickel transport system permease protein